MIAVIPGTVFFSQLLDVGTVADGQLVQRQGSKYAGISLASLTGTTSGTFASGNDARILGALPAIATYPSLLLVGDSLVASGTGGQQTFSDWLAGTWPFTAAPTYHNAGSGGLQSAQLDDAFHAAYIHPYTPAVTTDLLCYAPVLIGINDCRYTSDSASVIFARIKAIWARLRADGCKVIAMTIPIRDDNSTYNPTTVRAINSMILAASAFWDYVVDFATNIGGSFATVSDGGNVHPLTESHRIGAYIPIQKLFKYPTAPNWLSAVQLKVGSWIISADAGQLTFSGNIRVNGQQFMTGALGLASTSVAGYATLSWDGAQCQISSPISVNGQAYVNGALACAGPCNVGTNLNVSALGTVDPHVVGQFWRNGNSVMVSTG